MPPIVVAALALLGLCISRWTFAAELEPSVQCVEGAASEPLELTYGNHTADCAIDVAGDRDRFVFDGIEGERVRAIVRSLATGLDARIEIKDHNGSIVAQQSCDGNPAYVPAVQCTSQVELTVSTQGPHEISVLDSGSNETGAYLLQLERIPPVAPAQVAPYDSAIPEDIAPQTDLDFFRFDGTQGTQVRIVLRSRTAGYDAHIEIIDPEGALVDDTYCQGNPAYVPAVQCTALVDATLEISGSYLIVVSDAGSDEAASYTLGTHCLFGDCPTGDLEGCATDDECNDENGCTDDTCIDGGCTHVANSAACGDDLYCDGDDTCVDGSCVAHSLDPCQGDVGAAQCLESCLSTPFECNGVVEPGALEYGDWTANCTISPLTDSDRYTFHGIEGDTAQFTIRSGTSGYDPQIQVRDPDGAIIVNDYCNGNPAYVPAQRCTVGVVTTLAATGLYEIAIFDSGFDEVGSYLFQLERLPSVALPLGLPYGSSRDEGLDPSTDTDFFELAATADTQIQLTVTSGVVGLDPHLIVRDLFGTVVLDTYCQGNPAYVPAVRCTIDALVDIDSTGTYLLTVRDAGADESGPYTIRAECSFGSCPVCDENSDCENSNICEFNHRCVDRVCRADRLPGCPVVASDKNAGWEFGTSVAISADTMVIGAPAKGRAESGQAYIFTKQNGTFIEQQQENPIPLPLRDPEALDPANFGTAVDIDGDTVVVGTPFDQITGDGFTSVGSVSVFRRTENVWNLEAKLVASAAVCDEVGTDVAIDGDTIVAGGPGGDCALVFQRTGTAWLLTGTLLPDPPASARFGQSVGISVDAIVVGAPGTLDEETGACAPGGSVHVFVRDQASWSLQQRLPAPDGDADDSCFGTAVDIDGNKLAVGSPGNDDDAANAGAVFVYTRAAGTWSPSDSLHAFEESGEDHRFGASLDLSSDTILVGAPGIAAYVCSDLCQCRIYDAPLSAGLGNFCASTALGDDKLACGAPNEIVADRLDTGTVYPDNRQACGDNCGNGHLDAGEDCDGTECCDDNCAYSSSGKSCTADDNECTTDQCNGTGACVHVAQSGQPCAADENECTLEQCDDDGACAHVAQPGKSCTADTEVCTAEQCDTGGACVSVPQSGVCTDTNACTVGDSCTDGTCQPGADSPCDDNCYRCSEGECVAWCGFAAGSSQDPAPHASDALTILRAAVGLMLPEQCRSCVCDTNNSKSITATDALLALRKAVGQAVTLDCPACCPT